MKTCPYCADDNQAGCGHSPATRAQRIQNLQRLAAECCGQLATIQEQYARETLRSSHPEEAVPFLKMAKENREAEAGWLARVRSWTV